MADPDHCPMCGQGIDWKDSERICGTCRMAMRGDRAYFAVGGHGRYATFCSSRCVRSYILLAGTE